MARKSPPKRRASRKRQTPRSAAKRKAAPKKKAAAKPARRSKPAKRGKTSRPKPARKVKAALPRRTIRRPKPRPRRPFPTEERAPIGPPSTLQRERRVLSEDERLETGPALPDDRMLHAARTGHDELRLNIERHNAVTPVLTAGDVDARWDDAYAVGDEAPGGDNPTPDQDRVDDIGKALGINYQDNEELQGGDELADRDRHRWELDPASSDDWPHDKDK